MPAMRSTRYLLCLLLTSLACGRPSSAPAPHLETGLAPIFVEPCRLTNNDRERLDCLYAEQDCEFACASDGGVRRFVQFPDAGELQCACN